MRIKEYTYYDEHGVMHGSVGLLYCTPKTNIELLTRIKIQKKIKNK